MKFANLLDEMMDTNLLDEMTDTIERCGLPLKLDDITTGDGNCWARAAVQQMERTELQIQPNKRTMDVLHLTTENRFLVLKRLISQFMTNSVHPTIQRAKTEFDESVGLTDNITWEEFWKKMERDGEWANGTMVQATAWFLGCDINIVLTTAMPQTLFIPISGNLDDAQKSCSGNPLWIGHNNGRHYQSLLPIIEEVAYQKPNEPHRNQAPYMDIDSDPDSLPSPGYVPLRVHPNSDSHSLPSPEYVPQTIPAGDDNIHDSGECQENVDEEENTKPQHQMSDDYIENISKNQIKSASQEITKEAIRYKKKICVAPAEGGEFRNWNDEDIYLEESLFPHLFPYGNGGYVSSVLAGGHNMGFAVYVRNRLKHANSKFRKDSTYVFFLQLIKEQIEMRRGITTHLRKTKSTPGMTKQMYQQMDKENVQRHGGTYMAFKHMRGTSMYFQDAKARLMATLQQNGAPHLFQTISMAEYQWDELFKSIYEAAYKEEATPERLSKLSRAQRSKLITDDFVMTTSHFQKRVQKLITTLTSKKDFLAKNKDGDMTGYEVVHYFYRIEFQARGAPHLHSLLWLGKKGAGKLENQNETEITESGNIQEKELCRQQNEAVELLNLQPEPGPENETDEGRKQRLENWHRKLAMFHDQVVSTTFDDVPECDEHSFHIHGIFDDTENQKTCCDKCSLPMDTQNNHECCSQCLLKTLAKKYETHKCGFTCHKKKKVVTILANEGHGALDGEKTDGEVLSKIPVCRFSFPKYPMRETKVIHGFNKDLPAEEVKVRKDNLMKIKKFLLRSTYCVTRQKLEDNQNWNDIKNLTFDQFLDRLGMDEEQYLNALQASVRGLYTIIGKRNVKDAFTNNFNVNLMNIHPANHDIQAICDPYAVAQYVAGYLSKAEAGISKLLNKLEKECGNNTSLEKLKKIRNLLDRQREESIQECVWRSLGFPMTKFSHVVKFINTNHPQHRDCMVRPQAELEEMNEEEVNLFLPSPHKYYENRPAAHEDICMAMWSKHFDYFKTPPPGSNKDRLIALQNNMGFVRQRRPGQEAIIRFRIDQQQQIEQARSLCMLFLPYRNEMQDIHEKDVVDLVAENHVAINDRRGQFINSQYASEIMKKMVEEIEQRDILDDSEDDEDEEEERTQRDIETTNEEDIQKIEKEYEDKARLAIGKEEIIRDMLSLETLLSDIRSLNQQQRKIFDDIIERGASRDIEDNPLYLYIAGDAGTGKSYTVKLIIYALRQVFHQAQQGEEEDKPTVLPMAPTACAARILGGKTYHSAMQLNPTQPRNHVGLTYDRRSRLRFMYENLKFLVMDEVSMLGAELIVTW